MDQISRIRLKNLLDRLLTYCENAGSEEEKAVLLRINVIVLNKLRIHSESSVMLGHDVRSFNRKLNKCKDRSDALRFWEEAKDMVQAYWESMAPTT